MPDTIKSGTILIKDGTLLPTDLLVESERYAPNWKAVKRFDGFGLDPKINEANWNFCYLAGEIRATVLCRDRPGTLRRAVKCGLAKQEGQKFNSVDITKVVSSRFLGIPFMSVTAHSRHIQQGVGLVPVKDFALSMPAAPNREVATKQYTALISSS